MSHRSTLRPSGDCHLQDMDNASKSNHVHLDFTVSGEKNHFNGPGSPSSFPNRNPHTGIPSNVKYLHERESILATGNRHKEGAKLNQVSQLGRNFL